MQKMDISGNATSASYSIQPESVGYRLLKKAGWQEGTGLGAANQGVKHPIELAKQRGNRGLGFETKAPPATNEAEKQPPAASKRKKSVVDSIVNAELASEDIDTKVKRHRAVMLREAEEAKERAIKSYIFRAFSEPSDSATSGNMPTTRNHRLSALNPLLD